jgi:hypothetical protein
METLQNYLTQISNIQVESHTLTTKRSTWNKFEKSHPFLKEINNQIFNGIDSVSLTRQNIKDTKDIKLKIIKTIYWGYKGGMRGNNFSKILDSIDEIVYQFKRVESAPKHLKETIVREKIAPLKGNGFSGMKMSTISKILYFMDMDSYILDMHVINSMQRFTEFKELGHLTQIGKTQNEEYFRYNRVLDRISERYNLRSESIELFLFQHGQQLSKSN